MRRRRTHAHSVTRKKYKQKGIWEAIVVIDLSIRHRRPTWSITYLRTWGSTTMDLACVILFEVNENRCVLSSVCSKNTPYRLDSVPDEPALVIDLGRHTAAHSRRRHVRALGHIPS